MAQVSIKQLLEAGVHFGHQSKRWNPKMKKFIFGERDGIYIIDLQKTLAQISEVCGFLTDLTAKGGYVLFVGTKKQAQETVGAEAARSNMFFVNQRWLGGTLTNYETVKKSIKRMEEIEKMKNDGTLDLLTKKEAAGLNKELGKLSKNLSGIRNMHRLPGALFVVDSKREETAVREANKLQIPVVAMIDTNGDPDMVDYIIPANDDAIRSIKLITALVADCIIEGRARYSEGKEVPQVPAEASPQKPETEQLAPEAGLAVADTVDADLPEEIVVPVVKVEKKNKPVIKARKKGS